MVREVIKFVRPDLIIFKECPAGSGRADSPVKGKHASSLVSDTVNRNNNSFVP